MGAAHTSRKATSVGRRQSVSERRGSILQPGGGNGSEKRRQSVVGVGGGGSNGRRMSKAVVPSVDEGGDVSPQGYHEILCIT